MARAGTGTSVGSKNNTLLIFTFMYCQKDKKKQGQQKTDRIQHPEDEIWDFICPSDKGLGAHGGDLFTPAAMLITWASFSGSPAALLSLPWETSAKAALGTSTRSYQTVARGAPTLQQLTTLLSWVSPPAASRGAAGKISTPSPPFPPFFPQWIWNLEGLPGREGLQDFSFPFLLAQPLQNKQPPEKQHSTA